MNLETICQESIKLVTHVGEFILKEFQNFDSSVVEEKERHSLVSYVDRQAEKQLVDKLSQIVPQAGFIAEEGTGEPQTSGMNWIVDPLDGTTNFVHGIPVFAISIGLMHEGDVVLGIVYEVNRRECFYATKGNGAFLNGNPIHISESLQIGDSVLATGFPYFDHEHMSDYVRVLSVFMKKVRAMRRMGSAAVDLAYTAAGRFDGYFEHNLNPWDVAGGACIVREAGGIVSDFSGGNDFVFGKQIIAANPTIHAKMKQVIQHLFPQKKS